MPSYLVRRVEAMVGSSLSAEWFEHALRVRALALRIAREERLSDESAEIVELASLLHDYAFSKEPGGLLDHAMTSSKMAREALQSFEMPVPLVDRVCHCIEAHSYYTGIAPQSAEAKVLFDANSLEVIGPVGVMRICLGVKDFEEKSVVTVAHKLRAFSLRYYDALHTPSAKRIAKKYWNYQEGFLGMLDEQLNEK